MSRRGRALGALLLVLVIAVGVAWVANRPPVIPADAAGTALGRTVMTDGHGQRCLDRAELGVGWADICWSVDRIPDGSDNTQDYYEIRVSGSFQALKWLLLRADLVGAPDSGAYVMWPTDAIEGSCRQVAVHLKPTIGVEPTETVCGRTEGHLEIVAWTQTATWTCELCLLPDGAPKPIATYGSIAVVAGTVPAWDLFVDGGS